jgi:hypothetical protein
MIVADISMNGILGFDFLSKQKDIINLRTHQIDISGIEHSLQWKALHMDTKCL